jgi:hypothetical protein
MDTRTGVEDRVTGGHLEGAITTQITDDEFTAVVFLRIVQRESERQVGADTASCAVDLP